MLTKMDLKTVLQSTYTCRYYSDEGIEEPKLKRVLDAARWGPSGGNRQPVSLVVVRDPKKKLALQELYLPLWEPYVKGIEEGDIKITARDSNMLRDADHFARNIANIPVLIKVCARLGDVHPTDTELDRLSIVGGSSVYPPVQNILLSARSENLGSALTTLLCAVEPEVKKLLKIPEDVSTAAMITLGYPLKDFPKKLNRKPIEDMCWEEHYGEKMF